ncbi:MAG: T9SS type A sorting domain-containing protein, partial [Ignavibacteriae bacterium]|nr:T9SS type A sorting domain-containing protein [Ignavibacteriota bacterium]
TSNPLNGKSLRGIASFVDSTLTYWKPYIADATFYPLISYWFSRINAAFAASIDTISTNPLKLTNTRALFSVPFLLTNSAPPPFIPSFQPAPEVEELPSKLELLQNYPNPFNPVTTIEFTLPEPSRVTLKVFNILGQEVAVLLDDAIMDDGRQLVDFDASRLSSGVYFYQLYAEGVSGNSKPNSLAKKMILVK